MNDRLGKWCGGVLIWVAAMTPLLAYVGPLGFALLPAIAGLLMAPAFWIRPEDHRIMLVLVLALVWGWISMVWSPQRPTEFEDNAAAKLTLALPLFWSAWCGARRADPRLGAIALRILGYGMAGLGLILGFEALTGAALYRAIHEALYEPIRPDIAMRNLGRDTFVVALIWPLAALGAARAGAPRWLAAPMVIGMGLAAHRFGSDAPLLAVVVAGIVGWMVWRSPLKGANSLGWVAACFFLFMPALVMAGQAAGIYQPLRASLQLSWAERMDFWAAAVDLIGQHRLRGWGLDASRTFSPQIRLHPHNGAIQAWLELGLVGAFLAAGFWGLSLRRLTTTIGEASWVAPVTAACASVYLLFGAVNFGLWQEWWLGLGVLVAMLAALTRAQPSAAFEQAAP
ncbi:O-antigen ligase family protein [Phenylobacterium immobile]|uniref:O-antigen ligase family protein n=1 Tax=Phenylobacterium immobile TaxID=21 RepID=UPI000AA2FD37|nr:O-antigen ligase family protein [Phenylobacterium immobile]